MFTKGGGDEGKNPSHGNKDQLDFSRLELDNVSKAMAEQKLEMTKLGKELEEKKKLNNLATTCIDQGMVRNGEESNDDENRPADGEESSDDEYQSRGGEPSPKDIAEVNRSGFPRGEGAPFVELTEIISPMHAIAYVMGI
nr:unnamed protein product [Haemonchus contortus]